MMQTADSRDGDDLSDSAWHDRARVGAILVERKMRPRAVIVSNVSGEHAAQMALVEDDHVIQTLATDRTDVRVSYANVSWVTAFTTCD